jgi:F420-dependent oxidoreductase-like protein
MVAVSISVEGMFGLTWERWRRLTTVVEQLGFDGLFRSDHFTLPFPVDLDSLEMIVSLTYLADHTERVHFGPLVAPISFRDPVMLARQAAAIDDLSGGRMVLGLGAGWEEREHGMFGYRLGNISTRFARFAEGLQVITRLLDSDGPVSYTGRFFSLRDAVLLPRPGRRGGPPILVGGAGPTRTLPLAARYADIWNAVSITPAQFHERSEQLDTLIKAEGRRAEDVRRTMTFIPLCRRDPAELERRLAWNRNAVPMFGSMPVEAVAEMLRETMNAFVGSPDELVAHIADFGAAGADEVMLQWSSLDDIEGLEVLAEHVLPAVRKL